MFKVQYNVPIPSKVRSSPTPRRKYPFDAMGIGGFFFVPGRSKNTLGTHVSTVSKQLGCKFATRLTFAHEIGEDEWELCPPDAKGAVQGVGVWRTA